MNPFSKPCFWLVLNHNGTPIIIVYFRTILDRFGKVLLIRHRHRSSSGYNVLPQDAVRVLSLRSSVILRFVTEP